MLFMVVERFHNTGLIGERYQQSGRMLPEGVNYLGSWVEPSGNRCFQLMEAANRELLNTWTVRWQDLAEFEINEVLPSADFWRRERKQ